ncbi:MAG: hybrid sensor histidine kinase/response regulator, partial [Planctomycetales bacterium]|nr:hybrid sensor histidine kinase/response regulator [Planctomycetales bacterium]
AHDFNNLLTVILGECDLNLARLGDASPHREAFETIQQTAKRAAALTKQLLMFSRQQPFSPCVLDLNGLLRSSQTLLERLVGKSVECVLSLSHEPLLVYADPNQLEQVIYNLASNARDAMPDGGRITFRTRRVEQTPQFGVKRWVVLAVQDTGEGFSPQESERVFEPFFSTKEPGKGTGLGLAVVHGIVEQCQGRVIASSLPEGGALFLVLLPEEPGAPRVPAKDPGEDGDGI